MDVSFISVTKILPALPPLLKDGGKIITLIKPQFEVGRGEVGKGGIVRDAEKHDANYLGDKYICRNLRIESFGRN